MNETPIIFSPESVLGIIAGRKTQTRRVIQPQPEHRDDRWVYDVKNGGAWQDGIAKPQAINHCCRYHPGLRLWVREAFSFTELCEAMGIDDWYLVCRYKADGKERFIYECDAPLETNFKTEKLGKARHAMFMPRWATRITLEVTEVRAERVQDISEADALAEGVNSMCDTGLECTCCDWRGWEDSKGVDERSLSDGEDWEFLCPKCKEVCAHHPLDEIARCEYRKLWDSINAKRGYPWNSNPWVWAVSFRVLDTTGHLERVICA